jgi:hypothetical protein
LGRGGARGSHLAVPIRATQGEDRDDQDADAQDRQKDPSQSFSTLPLVE